MSLLTVSRLCFIILIPYSGALNKIAFFLGFYSKPFPTTSSLFVPPHVFIFPQSLEARFAHVIQEWKLQQCVSQGASGKAFSSLCRGKRRRRRKKWLSTWFLTSSLFKKSIFKLEDNCFTMLCWFLVYINMNQL